MDAASKRSDSDPRKNAGFVRLGRCSERVCKYLYVASAPFNANGMHIKVLTSDGATKYLNENTQHTNWKLYANANNLKETTNKTLGNYTCTRTRKTSV